MDHPSWRAGLPCRTQAVEVTCERAAEEFDQIASRRFSGENSGQRKMFIKA